MTDLTETLRPPAPNPHMRLCRGRDCGNAADVTLSRTRVHTTTREVFRAQSAICSTCYVNSTPVARVA